MIISSTSFGASLIIDRGRSMSNPGVITLSQIKISDRKKFRVEDNLGEAVHLHYNDIRVDLSVKELLYLGDEADKVILDRVHAEGFDLSLFPGDSLLFVSPYLVDLERVVKEKVPAKRLLAETRNRFGLPVWKRITETTASLEKKEEDPIVLFNDQDLIRYGSAYAIALCGDAGNSELPVLRLYFRDGLHGEKRPSWSKILLQRLKMAARGLFRS